MEARSEEHSLSDKQFKKLCDLVYDSTGIVLAEGKRQMVYRRLMRRIRELQLKTFPEYYALLENNDDTEWPNFLNAITTNFTSFFRENHHFEYLKSDFLPKHCREFGRERLRVWSTASSTGEEPYSLAITLRDFYGHGVADTDCRILATDLDTNVLETARAGIYEADRIEGLPEAVKRKNFKQRVVDGKALVKVDQELQQLIAFKQLNLMHDWPMRGPFDVIMCRNVMIYFDKPTQAKLLKKFMRLLRPSGVLMLGHSESIAKDFSQLKSDGKTTYIKVA